MMGPSAIGAQPPPEEMEEWENPTVHDDPDEPCEWDDSDPFCTCSTGHSIEETDWNQCDSCGKPIYDEEPAAPPAPTFADGMTAEDDRRFLELTNDLTHNSELSGPRPLAAEGSRSNDVLGAERPGKD